MNIKYNIKVTKNGSLIGITEFVIPSTIFSKKNESYEKTCSITMTDSTRKLLFGNTNLSNTIKINIHSMIEYTEKTSNILKQSHSLPREEIGIKNNNNNNTNQLNKANINIQMKKNSSMIHKQANNSTSSIRDNKTPPMRKIQKNTNSSVTTSNYKSPSNKKNNARTGSATIRKNSYGNNNNNNFNNSSNNFNNSSNKILTRDNLNEKEEKKNDFEEPENDPKDNSLIDPLILKEISEVDNNFIQFMSNFMEKNPLEQINQFNNNNINECIIHTKEIIDQLFEYQNNYYNKFKESVALNNILIDDFNKYNELYRRIIKKENKLNELIENNQIKKEIVVNIRRGENNHIRQILPLKHREIDLYKDVYNVPFTEKDVQEYSINKENLEKQNKLNNEETEKILVKAIKNISKNLGDLESVFNNENLSDLERKKLNKLINKYQLNISNQENEFQNNNMNNNNINNLKNLEYVNSNIIDKVDEKLDNNLKSFYNKKKIPKIPFKKISPNNYEYGTMKVTIKDDDIIKVKYIGGYYSLDKFIELNAPIEEIKAKKQNITTKKRK
jgi:hypothetical protein